MRSLSLVTIAAFAAVSFFPAPRAHAALSSYSQVKDFLKKTAAKHPESVKLFDLGLSDSGDTIQGLKIGNGPVHNMVVSTHHGNEYGSTEVAMSVATDLANSPIQGQTVFVIPVLNIDGYNHRDRYETDASGNSNDPNRDYPGPCGTEGPHHLKDTKLLAQFIDQQNIVASATLHTFYPAVVYPWGIASQDLSTPYDDLFKQLVAAATQESQYQTGNSTEVIYAANGTYEDYAFWKHGIWSILFELGVTHTPDDSQVAEMVKVNTPGIRRLLTQAPRQRAEKHDFTGKCDDGRGPIKRDRHDE